MTLHTQSFPKSMFHRNANKVPTRKLRMIAVHNYGQGRNKSLFHLQLDWNYCFSRSLKFLQCWFSVFFCFFDPFFKSILLLLELFMTVLLDLISIYAESLSTFLGWQSGSQSGLKNPLTVHFIRPFQATSSSIGWFKYVRPFCLPALSFRISSITIFRNF